MIADLRQRLQAVPEDTLGRFKLQSLLTHFEKLSALELSTYGQDGSKQPSEAELEAYAKECRETQTALREVGDNVINEQITDPTVKQLSTEYAGQATEQLRLEIKPFLAEKYPPFDWKLTDAQSDRAKQLLDDCRKTVSTRGVGYAKQHYVGGLPQAIQLTGDLNDLASYYAKYENALHNEQKAYLLSRIENKIALDAMQEAEVQKEHKPKFPAAYTSSAFSAHLQGYDDRYQIQSTGNGCWSCAYAMLLESRGVSLDQRAIRNFRPEGNRNRYQKTDKRTVAGLVGDQMFSPFELADLTGKMLPKTAMRQMILKGVETKEQKSTAYNALQETIRDALKENQSPVALRRGKHFVTIVGIEGDKLTVLNSNVWSKSSIQQTVKLSDLVNQYSQFGLTWLHDMQFNEKGKCTNLPGKFENKIDYVQGKLISGSEDCDLMNVSGGTFYDNKPLGQDNGTILCNDSIYVPSEIPAAQLNLTAQAAPKQTEKLAEEKQPTEKQEPAETGTAKKTEKTEETPKPKEEPKTEEVPKVKEESGPKEEPPKAEDVPKSEEEPKAEEPPKTGEAPKAEAAPKVEDAPAPAVEDLDAAPVPEGLDAAPTAGDAVRETLVDAVNDSYDRVCRVAANASAPNSERVLRYSVANMLANKAIQLWYDQSSDPQKYEKYAEKIKSPEELNKMLSAPAFNEFYNGLKRDDFSRLVNRKPEEKDAAINEAYNKFIGVVNKARKEQEKPDRAKTISQPKKVKEKLPG